LKGENESTEGIKGESLEIKIYTPDSALKSPSKLLTDMWRDLLASRELARRLLIRDISARYRQSFLGLFWAFIPPIAMAAGLLIARNTNIINIGETSLPYAAYVMLSMVLWQTFTESVMSPINAMQEARPMLVKIDFPREALILTKIGDVLFNFSIKLFLVIALFAWFKLEINWLIIFFPLSLASLIAFGFFIGTLLAPIAAIYTDIARGLTILLGVWFFLTPVIYPLPESGWFSVLVDLNPVTHLLVTTRELATASTLSNIQGFILSALLAFAGLLVAWIFFRIAMPSIIERMSA